MKSYFKKIYFQQLYINTQSKHTKEFDNNNSVDWNLIPIENWCVGDSYFVADDSFLFMPLNGFSIWIDIRIYCA